MYLFWLRVRSSLLHAGFLQLLQTGATVELRCTGFSPRRLLPVAASPRGGFSLQRRTRALGHRLQESWHRAHGPRVLERRLRGCGTGPGRSAACGLSLDQGWKPGFLHWQMNSLPLDHQSCPLKDQTDGEGLETSASKGSL